MALQKQKVPVNLAAGIDTKTDKKHLSPGRLPVLNNARMRNITTIDKRNGHDVLTMTDINAASLGNPEGIFEYNDELLLYRGQELYSYYEDVDKWKSKGRACFCNSSVRDISFGNQNRLNPILASNGDYTAYASFDTGTGLTISIVEEATGNYLVNDAVVASSTGTPGIRVMSFQDKFYFFYGVDTGVIKYVEWDPATPGVVGSPTTIVSDHKDNTENYEVLNISDTYIIFGYGSSSNQLTIKILDEDFASVVSDFTEASSLVRVLSLCETATGYIQVTWGDANSVEALTIDTGGNTINAKYQVQASSGAVSSITSVSKSDGDIYVYYSVGADTRKVILDEDGNIVTANAIFKYQMYPFSKLFIVTDSTSTERVFMLMTGNNSDRSTYYLVRDDGLCVSRNLDFNGLTGLNDQNVKSDVVSIDGKYRVAVPKAFELEAGGLSYGVSAIDFDFTSNNLMLSKEFSKNLFIAGGCLNIYDGYSVVEHGFHQSPYIASGSDDTGGNLVDGDYTVVFLYEWIDAKGQRQLSSPSIPETFTVSGRSGSGEVNVQVYTLQLTEKGNADSNRNDVQITGYVSVSGVYYKFTTKNQYTNDPSSETVSIRLATLVGVTDNQILYTTGGVLENDAPPSCTSLEVYKNRLWLAGTEESESVWYSKENLTDEAIEFNSTLILKNPDETLPDTGLKILDDKLLVFKSNGFYYTYGDGPNNLGQDGSFVPFQGINSDAGCENPHAVVATPLGVMVKNQRGIYNIGSSFQVEYIGADVEAYNSLTVSSSLIPLGNKNEIKFTTTSGSILVFDYVTRVWSVDTGLTALGAVNWRGKYTLLASDGVVYVDNPAVWEDGATSYSLGLETGWFSFDRIGGFQRIYQMQLRGDYKSDHDLTISIAYDHLDTWVDSATLNPLALIGASAAYRFQVYMKRQKCEAMRFKIVEVPNKSGTEQSLSLSDITFLVGVKMGTSKLANANVVGANTI